MKRILQILAVASLAVCIWTPIQVFTGGLSEQDYKSLFLAGSIGWFVFATAAFAQGKR